MRDTNVTIAVVAPQEPFEFFELFWEGVWSAAHELSPLGVNVLTVCTGEAGSGEQTQALRDLLAQNIQAVILLPEPAIQLNYLIEQHILRGRQVVTVLRDAPVTRRSAFVGTDYRSSGRMAGDLLAKLVKPKSHVVALTGPRDAVHLKERFDGFRDALMASKVPLGLSTFDDADHFANIIGGRGQKFDALYLGCSESANLQNILEQVRPQTRCVAFNLTDTVRPFLRTGVVSAVIDNSRYYQGYLAVQKAWECVQSNLTSASSITIPSSVILPEHVALQNENISLDPIFETIIRQRTLQLRKYKQELDVAKGSLLRVAETDPLTELLNRRKFEQKLGTELSNANVYSPLSMIVADIDDFHSFNELLGTAAGDHALKLVGSTLRSVCRASDVIARIGADEFAIGLPDTDTENALGLRERIESAIEKASLGAYPDIRLSVSVGIVTVPGSSARSVPQMIELAQESAARRGQSRRTLIRLPKTG